MAKRSTPSVIASATALAALFNFNLQSATTLRIIPKRQNGKYVQTAANCLEDTSHWSVRHNRE
jgi:hypothetical protein